MQNKLIRRRPSRKKLVYPLPVSMGYRGINRKATRAFTRISEREKKYLREVEGLVNKASRSKTPEQDGYHAYRGEIVGQLHWIASASDYFIKPDSPKTKKIRAKLKKAGIQVEEPIEDLKNGTSLFARAKWKDVLGILRDRTRRKPAFYEKLIRESINLLIRVHQQNIAHNHFHRRNVVFDKNGEAELIDLSIAQLYKNPPATKQEFLRRYSRDIAAMAQIVGNFTECIYPNTDYNYTQFVEQILTEYRKQLPTFGVTATEILEFRRW